ncbi:type ISP restriction/modification enzyme [Francisella hispaniensis]|uniref:type ISP restriction/modification enzyme n=1 Tax=Francisella hispaniensis TaxID=622488 RepID=UPI0005C76DAF|nr:type ISP restriction/modification enzyme [Francisella hispaniensis]
MAPLSRGAYSLKTNVGVVPCADSIRGQPQGFAPTIKPNGHTHEGGYLTDTSNNVRDSRLHGNDGDINSPSDMKGWQSQTDGVVLKNFAPIDILDYIYAVLHSPSYREKYKEFLKIDFPRVPYPTIETFWQLVELGSQLRQIHLLESPVVTEYITSYPVDGDNIVDKPTYKGGKVYINKEQYFDNVPEVAWNFYIGSYQPAQKWLKDRKGRELGFEDILHYQKIIVALTETDRLMREIDKIEF